MRAPEGSVKRKQYQKELEDAISHREQVDCTFEEIGKAVFGDDNGIQMIKTVRSAGQPVVDDWDCFKTLVYMNFSIVFWLNISSIALFKYKTSVLVPAMDRISYIYQTCYYL